MATSTSECCLLMKSAICLFVCYLPFLVHRVNTVWSGKRFCSKFSFIKWRFTNLKILLHVVHLNYSISGVG